MTNQEIVKEYLRCFCESDIVGLEHILAPDLTFTGTFHTYHSSAEYLNSLKQDPPEPCGYKMLSITETDNSVAVFYEYQKPDRMIHIAQLFKITCKKIHDVLLVFDGRGFDEPSHQLKKK